MAGSNSPGIIGSVSPTAIARIRSGLRAATVRLIRSAIRRLDLERSGLDDGLAVARRDRERHLSRTQSGDGLAARAVRRFDRAEPARAVCCARTAGRRTSAGDAARDNALCAAGRAGRLAARDPDLRQPAFDRLRHLPPRLSTSSTADRADRADVTGVVVVCRGDRAWSGIDAGADLSRTVP